MSNLQILKLKNQVIVLFRQLRLSLHPLIEVLENQQWAWVWICSRKILHIPDYQLLPYSFKTWNYHPKLKNSRKRTNNFQEIFWTMVQWKRDMKIYWVKEETNLIHGQTLTLKRVSHWIKKRKIKINSNYRINTRKR